MRGTVADIVAADKSRIVVVHICDGRLVPPAEVKDLERLLPGEGIIDLSEGRDQTRLDFQRCIMKHRLVVPLFVLSVDLFLVPVRFAAQATVASGKPAAKTAPVAKPAKWTPPRLADGRPDLQGFWSNNTATPLQRSAALGGREFVTAEEAKAIERQSIRVDEARVKGAPCVGTVIAGQNCGAAAGAGPGGVGDYNGVFLEDSKKAVVTLRSSIITDPKDGRLPPFTPEAQRQLQADRERLHFFDGPEAMSTMDRCLTGNQSGPPMLSGAYNNNYQIVQTHDHAMIVSEMIHDVRIIPLDGRPHSDIHQWMGDSRGRWEGDTLVVETTNFNGKRNWMQGGIGQRSDERMRVIERFTRTAQDILLYQFTVDDPATYTRPWSGEIPMTAFGGPVYEYACHEGNYAMFNILKGARFEEQEAAAAAKRGPR